MFVPEKLMMVIIVALCARSAHTLPRRTILSHVDSWACFSANLAARSLATFSIGVSIRGIGGFFGALGLGMRLGVFVFDLGGVVAEEGAERREVLE